MTGIILLVSFYLLFPVMVIYLSSRFGIIRRISSIVICYLAGLIAGNISIFPPDVYEIQDLLTTLTIPLAIPLILFSENVAKWVRMAKTTFFSLILGLISMLVMIILGYQIFKDQLTEGWKIAGMLTGVYSGGTPNLAAIQTMLKVDEETYILTHTADLVIGAIVLLFLLTVAQKFFLLFMRPYRHSDDNELKIRTSEAVDEFESYDGIFNRSVFLPLLKALGLSVLIFGVGGGISFLFPENSQTVAAILIITTLGITASLVPKINAIKKTFQLGMYFILVFCVVVASMADISEMFAEGQSVFLASIFLFILLAVVGSLFLHAILSYLFKIDADNFIITSVALSMSPPFVPVVAAALKNKAIVISGLIVGIIGYAMGNYLGVLVAYLLK